MLLSPGSNEAQTIRGTLAETGALHYPWFKAWVSPPLKARLFSGGPGYKIVCDFNEGSSIHNMYPKVYIYIWKGDDSGLRGLLSEIGFTQTECDTTDASLQTWESNFTYEVQAQDGDRLVIEMMGRDDNVKTVSYLHAINIDGAIGGNRESYFEVYLVLTFIDNKNLTCNCYIQALASGSKALSASAEIRNLDSKQLSSEVLIRNKSSKDLSSSAVIRHESAENLSSSALIRQSGSKSLPSEAMVRNIGSRELSSSTIVRNKDGRNLTSNAVIVNSDSKSLSVEAAIRNSGEKGFSAESSIRNKGSNDLSSTATIRIGDFKNLPSEASIRNKGTGELPCNADIHQVLQSGSENLSSQVIIRNLSSIDLPSNAEIRQSSWIRISLEAVIRNKGEKDLSSEAIIQGVALNQLSCMALIRNASSKGLPSSASVRNKGSRNLTNNCFISLLANDLSCQAQIGALVPEEFAIIKGEIIGDEQKAIIGAKVIYQEVS